MPNRIFPIAATSLVSMLAGVSITLVFAAETLEAVPDERTDAMFDVAQGLQRTQLRLDRVERVLERELAATRRDVHMALDHRTREAPSRVVESADEQAERGVHVRRDDASPVSPKNADALARLTTWKTDTETRSAWLFASEARSLDSFGTPDEVAARGTSEWWTYWNVSGDAIESEHRLQFNNGRLVDAMLVEWRQPRALPTARR